MDITVACDRTGGLSIWVGWISPANLHGGSLRRPSQNWPDYYITQKRATSFLERCAEVTEDTKILGIQSGQLTWTQVDELPGERIVRHDYPRE